MFLKGILLYAALSCLVAVSSEVTAATWHVDASVETSGDGTTWKTAFKTIQDGIDGASDGDAVIVCEGTYVENVHFEGKNIVLRSTDPLDSTVVRKTVIDGDHAGSVVSFAGSEGESCVLSGFTIRNGLAEYGGGIYGGLPDAHAHARIENNIIRDNWADFGGGLARCDGDIRNNIVRANKSKYAGKWMGGGGLFRCHGTIEGNIVLQNSTRWCGGGLFECQGRIRNNIVRANSAVDAGGLYMCHGLIENNRVFGNSAEHSGGGVYECDGEIRSNLVVDNSARFGGGLFWCKGVIRNNTICGNSAMYSGGIYGVGGPIRNCIIWGNTATFDAQLVPWSTPIYSCIQDWISGGEGNISQDPRFAVGYRLSPDSPCVDSGQNEDWMEQAVDLDGNPRILLGVGSASVDMGAYEYAPEGPSGKVWYVNGSVAESGDGTSWATAFKTIQRGIDTASHGDRVIVAQGLYVENIRFNGKDIVVRSTDPSDPGVVANTVIDGDQTASVVLFLGTEDGTCELAGFTVRNGKAHRGAGVCGGTYKVRCHALIQRNIISGNSAEGTENSNGGGLAYCDGVIERNTVSGNVAQGRGGGAYDCGGCVQRNIGIYG